jgi:membrane-associated protein
MAQRLREAEAFYERWGQWAVVVARFIPWVRTFTPILAGVARMPYRRFLVANVAGALCWGAGLVWLGHLAYSIPWVKTLGYAVAVTAIVGSLVVALVAWVRARRTRTAAPGQPRPSSSSPKT